MAVTSNFIQVPPQSTGLKVDTAELTVGANTVERQKIVLADPQTAANMAAISASQTLNVSTDGINAQTYRCALAPFSAGTGATTDIANLTGSASKTIRVTKVIVSSTTATAAVYYDLQLQKTSTASTGGTPVAGTVVPLDSGFAAGTATAQAFTAAPTSGTGVGIIESQRIFSGITGTVTINTNPVTFEFGRNGSSALVLRGVAQQLGVRINAVTPANAQTWDITFEWVEDNS
jgi:hypothetical protein